MSITAVIPVRAGSRRLPNKNILPFGNSNLLIHKIRQLKQVNGIDNIVVSSDSEEMLAMAKSEGVIPSKRPDEYCDEVTRSFNEVVQYIAGRFRPTDTLIWANVVCPLATVENFNNGIDLYRNMDRSRFDSVVSAKLFKEYLFGESGPINFSVERHVPSQKLPNWHVIVNGFFIAQAADMVKWRFVYGKNPLFVELNKFEAMDIDDRADFEICKTIWSMQRNLE